MIKKILNLIMIIIFSLQPLGCFAENTTITESFNETFNSSTSEEKHSLLDQYYKYSNKLTNLILKQKMIKYGINLLGLASIIFVSLIIYNDFFDFHEFIHSSNYFADVFFENEINLQVAPDAVLTAIEWLKNNNFSDFLQVYINKDVSYILEKCENEVKEKPLTRTLIHGFVQTTFSNIEKTINDKIQEIPEWDTNQKSQYEYVKFFFKKIFDKVKSLALNSRLPQD